MNKLLKEEREVLLNCLDRIQNNPKYKLITNRFIKRIDEIDELLQ